MAENYGRTATLGDVTAVSNAVDRYAAQDTAEHREIRREGREDVKQLRGDVADVRKELGDVRKELGELAVDSGKQNEKLDTLVARTASRDLREKKDADTKSMALVATKDHRRGLIRGAAAALWTGIGAVLAGLVHHFLMTAALDIGAANCLDRGASTRALSGHGSMQEQVLLLTDQGES